MTSPGHKRFLGWLWMGSLGGLAMAGLLLMVMQPGRLATDMVGLAMVASGLIGLALQFVWGLRRKR